MKQSKRQLRLANQSLGHNLTDEFVPIDDLVTAPMDRYTTRAYRNRLYKVTVSDEFPTTHGPAIRVMVSRHDLEPLRFHWREMMNIKNKLFGTEMTAVEYYPAMSNLIDHFNVYWMFIYPKEVLPIPKLVISL